LSENAHVRLAIYDLLGREVTVLVDESRIAGTYTVNVDARALSSGMYLYRLSVRTGMANGSTGSGSITLTRKMTVVK
jgi:hypothetical protein